MAQTQIADVIVPAEFTEYQVENSLVSTALFQSGVVTQNGLYVFCCSGRKISYRARRTRSALHPIISHRNEPRDTHE
jgi:hypothetical protein